jgi:hypothetical protein
MLCYARHRLELDAKGAVDDLSERSALSAARGRGNLPGLVRQFVALSSRHATIAIRHPLLVSVNNSIAAQPDGMRPYAVLCRAR